VKNNNNRNCIQLVCENLEEILCDNCIFAVSIFCHCLEVGARAQHPVFFPFNYYREHGDETVSAPPTH